ncbi:hypothetical protein LEP1GSC192_3098 [Leptospira sp. B5-022]|nr:hypothetical protein LEP1GSC192_3098 [Leptospira sp. B5-022]
MASVRNFRLSVETKFSKSKKNPSPEFEIGGWKIRYFGYRKSKKIFKQRASVWNIWNQKT